MTLADLIKDFLDSSRERVKNPFTGAFFISFIIYNWRPILLLMFSDAMMEDKIVVINNEYCSWHSIIAPLTFAAAYIVGIPYLMAYFDKLTTKAINDRVSTKYVRRVHDLTKLENVLQQQRKNEEVRSGTRDQEILNNQIDTLNTQIETINNQNKETVKNFEQIIADQELTIKKLTRDNTNSTASDDAAKYLQELKREELDKYSALTKQEQLNFKNIARAIINNRKVTINDAMLYKIFTDFNWVFVDSTGHLRLSTPGHLLYDAIAEE